MLSMKWPLGWFVWKLQSLLSLIALMRHRDVHSSRKFSKLLKPEIQTMNFEHSQSQPSTDYFQHKVSSLSPRADRPYADGDLCK